MRGFAISPVILARIALPDSFFDLFLVITHHDIRREAIQSGLEHDPFASCGYLRLLIRAGRLAGVCFMGQRSNDGACQYADQRQIEMLPCCHCSREVAPEMAQLSQDLDATPLAFCSAMCHEMWFEGLFAAKGIDDKGVSWTWSESN